MNENSRVIELLERIETNQRKALEAQQQQLEIAQAQLERSNKMVQESVELQRVAVSRQAQVIRIVIPLIVVLLVLLGYLLVTWRIFRRTMNQAPGSPRLQCVEQVTETDGYRQ